MVVVKFLMVCICLETDFVLGRGNFGTVFKGTAKGKEAAIKQPNKDCPKDTFKSVLSEIKVLCYIGLHPNVLEFLGAYVDDIGKGDTIRKKIKLCHTFLRFWVIH